AACSVKCPGPGELGHLDIGFAPPAALDTLPRVLRVWNARFPAVEIDLHPLLPSAQTEALRDGRIQIGFVRLPLEESALVVETIQREPLLAVLPAGARAGAAARGGLAGAGGGPVVMLP